MLFLNSCGCPGGSSVSSFSSQSAVPCLPVQGSATITNQAYLSLVGTQAGKLLAVPAGSTTQAFLNPVDSSSNFAMVVIGPDGQARATRSPAIPLPVANPPSGGIYPLPAATRYILIMGENGAWQAMAAPSTGEFLISAKNGFFSLKDAGDIPGLTSIAQSSTFAARAQVLGIVEVSSGVFALRKVRVVDKRVMVGRADGDGNLAYQPLADSDELTHPLGYLKVFRCYQYQATDVDGASIAGGLLQGAAFGDTPTTDLVLAAYSLAKKQFLKAAPRTHRYVAEGTNSATTAAPASYTQLPGNRCVLPAADYHYPTVRISAHVSYTSSSEEQALYALFRDGVQIKEFSLGRSGDTSIETLITDLAPGSHTFELRWKRSAGAFDAVFAYTDMMVLTLP